MRREDGHDDNIPSRSESSDSILGIYLIKAIYLKYNRSSICSRRHSSITGHEHRTGLLLLLHHWPGCLSSLPLLFKRRQAVLMLPVLFVANTLNALQPTSASTLMLMFQTQIMGSFPLVLLLLVSHPG
jgi:hypothetical protein